MILDDVPCGDAFPTCKFIKDAHKLKDKVQPQREKVQRVLERLEKAQQALASLRDDGLLDKVDKIEKLTELKSRKRLEASACEVELVRLEEHVSRLASAEAAATKRYAEASQAVQDEENLEVVSLRAEIDELQARARQLDAEKLSLASDRGRAQSDLDKVQADHRRRHELLQRMKVHELITLAVSRRGIPRLIVASQVPLINAEVAKILHGIVDFNVELEVDDESDSMDVFLNYGDSRRVIELGSGMEKMIASVAIRVALTNVTSLPKTDCFIVDEGFGALDDSGVEACNRLLVSLKRYFRLILVITHVEGIKDVADNILEITKVEKDALVTYGER
jgi:DNA repair exonuclease SbcCD ATPase subunit